MSDLVIETDGLGKRYGSVDALQDASVEIPQGAWGLLGPNGAGKTTLLKLLLGLTPPSEGKASVLGLDPTRNARGIREQIGYVPERDAYVPGLSGLRYVAYAGRLGGLPSEDAMQRAHDSLNFVGLDEARYRNVEDYSQGMRQRAKLAQAIVHSPRIVFLDEPTNGLDPDGREEMLRLIRSLATQHGITVILASHILPEVEVVCEGALVLDQGHVVANDRIDELEAVTEATYLVRIRGEAAGFEQAIQERDGSIQRTPEGLLVVQLAGDDAVHEILEAAQASGVEIRHLEPEREGLEDALVATLHEEAGA